MWHRSEMTSVIGLVLGAGVVIYAGNAFTQGGTDNNAAPNPYRMEANWAQLPADRKMGAAIAVEIDKDGKSVWVFDRCGGSDCGKSTVAPIMKLDASGKLVTSFGAGMFNFPHGLGVDR